MTGKMVSRQFGRRAKEMGPTRHVHVIFVFAVLGYHSCGDCHKESLPIVLRSFPCREEQPCHQLIGRGEAYAAHRTVNS